MDITLHYTEALVRAAVWRFCVRVVGWTYPVAVALLLTSLVLSVALGDRSWQVGVVGAVLLMALLFPAALYRNQLSAARFKLRALQGGPVVFRVGDASYSVRSAAGSAELPWNSIIDVWRYDDCWLLIFSKAHFMTFPLENVSPQMQSVILDRVRASGGKVS